MMDIPKLTKEERIDSFIKSRLSSIKSKKEFTKRELAEFCLKEIDYAFDLARSVDYKDIEEQFKINN